MAAATTGNNSWMVCLREGVKDVTKVLGDLRCDGKTQVGEAVLLRVTCDEEEVIKLEDQEDVVYVEPNSTASLYPGIQQMAFQDKAGEWLVTVEASQATEWKEYIKRSLPSVKILDDTKVGVDRVFKVRASEAEKMEMDNHTLVHHIERSSHGNLEREFRCVKYITGNNIWALSRIAEQDIPKDFTHSEYHTNARSTGKDVNVYILDSGIDVGHSEFREGIQRYTDVYEVGDRVGHGTAVASLVAGKTVGVAPQANLIDVKVTEDGNVERFNLITGLSWVLKDSKEKKNCIANISITFEMGASPYKSLINQIVECHKAGVTIVVAAGNNGSSAKDYVPAKLPQCITVASSTKNDQLAPNTNHGECVDVVAPGEDIRVANIRRNSALGLLSGTSLAAPIVSGVIARYMSEVENPGNPQDVATWLRKNCTQNQLALCGLTPNLLVHAPCSMIGRPCPSSPRVRPKPFPDRSNN